MIKLYKLNIFSYHFLSSHYRYYTIVASNKSSAPPLHQRTYGCPRAKVIFKSIKSSLCYPLSLGFFFCFFFHRGFFVVLDFIVYFFFNANIVHVPLIQICQCRFYSICKAHTHIVIFCFLFIFIICSLAHYILSSPYSRLPTEGCSTKQKQ